MPTFLETSEDFQWIRDVFKIDTTGYVCAVLFGNEDSPERIEFFSENRYDIEPSYVWTPN